MAVPTYDLMMRPLLELAAQQDITRRIAEQAMRTHFHLTDEEMRAVLHDNLAELFFADPCNARRDIRRELRGKCIHRVVTQVDPHQVALPAQALANRCRSD